MTSATSSRADYFSFLGLPRKLSVDMNDLEQRYRALSRQFHPDYFYNASPAERRVSLERSSHLNDAYRALKNPVSRIEYLLKLEGMQPSGDGARTGQSPQVPAGLLEEVFALNEELDEIRAARAAGAPVEEWKGRLERARKPIEQKRADHGRDLETLSRQWDDVVESGGSASERKAVLNALRGRFLERNYINNLLAGIERELNE
jgi:molecular chaperone HscB